MFRGENPRTGRDCGERGWTRTIDPCLKRALLCQLSYAPHIVYFHYLTTSYHYLLSTIDTQVGPRRRPKTLQRRFLTPVCCVATNSQNAR
jgi:hypothetical protein